MKKIITLFFAAVSFTGAFAQSQTTEEARRIILGDRRDTRTDYPNDGRPVYDERSTYPNNRRSSSDEINRDYDAKIRSIRNNRTLSNAEKDRIIRDLERERERRVRENRGYDNNDRRYENRRYGNDDFGYGKKNKSKNKGNNGKHLGWQKGKGNPHKN